MRSGGQQHGIGYERTIGDWQDTLGLLVAVWTALFLGGALAASIGRDAALLGSFGLASILCAADRTAFAVAERQRSRPRHLRRLHRLGRGNPCHAGSATWIRIVSNGLRPLILCLTGIALAPGLLTLVLTIGGCAELSPRRPSTSAGSPIVLIASLLLAPTFEEYLYRGRLLPVLDERVGRTAALLISSALFALPHLEPWVIVAALTAGFMLGALKLRTGRVSDCIAFHLGLNVFALEIGGAIPRVLIPPSWLQWGAVAAAALIIFVPRKHSHHRGDTQ